MEQLAERREIDDMAKVAFRRVTAVHSADYPDIPLLEFAAMMASGAGGAGLTVAAFPTDGVLSVLPSVAKRCAEARGLATPDLQLLMEPDLEGAFVTASDESTDLLVARQPRRIGRRTLARAGCSVCFLPEKTPARISRILACIDLDADGRDLLDEAARLYRSMDADELQVLHVCCLESYTPYGHHAVRTQRLRDLLQFVEAFKQPGISCTPLLEESGQVDATLARVANEQRSDLVVIGSAGGSLRSAGKLVADCGVPVLQLRLPKPDAGIRGRLRRLFSSVEPAYS